MRTIIVGFVIVASMALPAHGDDFNSLTNKPMISATGAGYNADPTGAGDSTQAINKCIIDAGAAHAVCVLPPGTYKIGSKDANPPWAGLTFPPPPTGAQTALLGLQNLGVGVPSLVYYGPGTAITIGNCSVPTPLIYGINLVNISVNAVSPENNINPVTNKPYPPPQYGIESCGLSEANWDGLSVGNGSTKGIFTGANIRFFESAEIDLLNVTVANVGYQPDTTGILFDDVYKDANGNPGAGNATITMHGGVSALYGFQNAIACKSCVNITFRDALLEANDYDLFVDNSTWTSSYDAVESMRFEGTEFLMDPQLGPTHNKVLQVNSTGGKKLYVRNLVFRNTKWQLSGGVTYPVELNIPSTGPYSVFTMKLDTNSIAGAITAVVDSNTPPNNPLASIFFTGENDITDASGITRPANVHGKATISDYAHPMAVNVLTDSGAINSIVSVPSNSSPDPGFGLVVTVPVANPLQPGINNRFTYELPISICTPNGNSTICTSTSAPATGANILISGLTGQWQPANKNLGRHPRKRYYLLSPVLFTGTPPIYGQQSRMGK